MWRAGDRAKAGSEPRLLSRICRPARSRWGKARSNRRIFTKKYAKKRYSHGGSLPFLTNLRYEWHIKDGNEKNDHPCNAGKENKRYSKLANKKLIKDEKVYFRNQ